MKFSIIIPAYNVESYIKRCIDSILSQDCQDFEILIVDDGSTDDTFRICDELSEGDKRIKILKKNNGGVSSARNVGLDNASGDWIWFVDADDWITPSSLLNLCRVIDSQSDFQAIVFGVNRVSHGVTYNLYTPSTTLCCYNNIEDFCNNIKYKGEIWCWLFKRSVIEQKQLRFTEGLKYGEDGEFTFKYMVEVVQIVSMPNVSYVQYDRPGSVMNTRFTYNTIINHETILRNLIEYVYKRNLAKNRFVKSTISTQLEHFIRCLIHASLSKEEEVKCKKNMLRLTTANLSLLSMRVIIKVYMYPLYKRIAK